MRKIVKNTSSGQRAQQLINPTKDNKRSIRVVRGGSWGDNPGNVRASYRSSLDPTYQNPYLGFRIVRNAS